MSKAYRSVANTRTAKETTPQTKKIPGREQDQKVNSAGGVSFIVDDMTRLDRFLILGTEGGSYYAGERTLTKENATAITKLIQTQGVTVVNRIVEISASKRAPKNDPALFALALAMTHGDAETKTAAYLAIPKVARIGTHLLHLAEYVNGMRGWGSAVRRGFGAWYNGRKPLSLVQQVTKYANRDGWTHRDVLRLVHPKPATDSHDFLFNYIVGKEKSREQLDADAAAYLGAVEAIKATTDASVAAKLIADYQLPREVVPTELLNSKVVWEALLPHMGTIALVRNLPKLTNVGIIGPMTQGTQDVIAKLSNAEEITKSGIHPFNVMVALRTYAAGHSLRGSTTWNASQKIVDALDDLFYAAFGNVVPTGKRRLIALDVSGSMGFANMMGVPGLSPRMASAALALVTMRTETNYEVLGFTSHLVKLNLTPKMRLDEAVRAISHLPFGGTDCAVPMYWALKNKVSVDAFEVITDNETWAGVEHPSQALTKYRRQTGIPAKLVVTGMTATEFSIADPTDAGMLDVVGFDAAAPNLIADFIRG